MDFSHEELREAKKEKLSLVVISLMAISIPSM
jgi:hypothetical protein